MKRFSLAVVLGVACNPSAPSLSPAYRLTPAPAPSVQVAPHEALITFPIDSGAALPWPAQDLPDRFAGPFYVALLHQDRLSVAATWNHPAIEPLPALGSVVDIAALLKPAECQRGQHVITCAWPLAGHVFEQGGRVVMRVTDARWLQAIWASRPQEAILRVDRPGHVTAGTIAVRIVYFP
jgi:hypothetical protein